MQQRKIIIVLKMEVVSGSTGGKIGDPVEYGKEDKPVPMQQGGGGNSYNQGPGSLNTMQGSVVPPKVSDSSSCCCCFS